MDKYFYEFIDELAYRLENYEDSKQWADWMRDSAQKYKDNGNLERFFRAFGGMGSFYDRYFYYTNITRVLCSVTSNIAKSLNNNKDDAISSILENKSVYDEEELNYLNYLEANYKLGNLHDITEEYKEEKKIK